MVCAGGGSEGFHERSRLRPHQVLPGSRAQPLPYHRKCENSLSPHVLTALFNADTHSALYQLLGVRPHAVASFGPDAPR